MPELFVLRHGKSDWGEPGLRDHDRPLAARGRRDAPRMGRWLVENGAAPDRVVSSTARRARETAEAAVEALGSDGVELTLDERLYLAPVDALLEVLQATGDGVERLMVVGHNPGLELLVEHLAGRVPEAPGGKVFPTAALARFEVLGEWSSLGPATARLAALVRPCELPD